MIPARWNDVKEQLQAVLEMEPEQRAAYLQELESADPEFRREVESLLESHQQAGDTFLNAPADEPGKPSLSLQHSAMIGRRVGSYQIVEWIGAGGMGEVFLASRADDVYRKRVALKLVRPGPEIPYVVSRFKSERQILAGLDHPNIARLLDGGTTEEGVPYFVMELIEGQPIDEYCDARNLSVAARLALFRQVCSAVQYAHQRLIVHRDIKPGNILVTADGTPKLLDFGIAKILSEGAADISQDATLTGFAALTPGYASPEQVLGKPITTASDVYSLGVVLYELLTGRCPYRVTGRSLHEIARAVCETEPEKPSAAAIRVAKEGEQSQTPANPSRRRTPAEGSPEKLRKRLEGDLDNIVLMAMRKEPMRRYASADEFSQDIQRHLDRVPVIARKATLTYRATKFVSRYRTAVAAAILVALSLVAGLILTIREARIARAERARAERRFNDVRNLSNTLLFQIDDAVKDLPGSTEAQHLLTANAQQYLDSLSQEAGGDLSLLKQLADGYQKLGMIQGSRRTQNLGDPAAAIASLRKAVALRETIVRANPSDRGAQHELQKSYEELADPLVSFDLTEGAKYVDKSLELAEALYRQNPADTALMHALALACQDEAHVLTVRNDFPRAISIQERGLELAKQLEAVAPSAPHQTLLSYSHKRLGGLLIAQKQYAQALAEYQASQAIDDSLLTAHPNDTNARYTSTFTYSDIGYIYAKQGNNKLALANYEKVLAIREQLAAADPHDTRPIGGVARTCGYISAILRDEKKPQRALLYDLRALAILERQSARASGDRPLRLELAQSRWSVGEDYLAMAESARDKTGSAQNARVAQGYLLQARAGIADAKVHGQLYGDLVTAPQEIEGELAKCGALLKRSQPVAAAGRAIDR